MCTAGADYPPRFVPLQRMQFYKQYKNVLDTALHKRSVLFEDTATTAFRLFHGAGDGVSGLTVDIYNEYLLIQQFLPTEDDELNKFIDAVVSILPSLPLAVKGILLKKRTKSNTDFDSRLVYGVLPPETFAVRQNGVTVIVELLRAKHTGLFLDMRQVRDALVPFYFDCTRCLTSSAIPACSRFTRSKTAPKALSILISLVRRFHVQPKTMWQMVFMPIRKILSMETCAIGLHVLQSRNAHSILSLLTRRHFRMLKTAPFLSSGTILICCGLLIKLQSDSMFLRALNEQKLSFDAYRSVHPRRWELVMPFNESDDFTPDGSFYLKAGLWRLR